MHGALSIQRDQIALLLVDLQEEHRRDRRYLAAHYDETLTNARRLLLAARSAGVMIFHAQYVRDFSLVPPRPFELRGANGEPGFSDPASGMVAICPEVAPLPTETVIVKNDASSFNGTELHNILKHHGIQWLVIAGAWTESCVAATVRDAIGAGFRVLLVKDACTSGTTLMHQTAILNLANRLTGGAITGAAAASEILAGRAAEVWRLQQLVPFRFDAANLSILYDSI
jgi:maleamate amidohydrolase